MIGCRIAFYRDVFGVPFKVARGTVEIQAARDLDRAVEAAKVRFARNSRIPDWRLRADHLRIEWCRDRPEAAPRAPGRRPARHRDA